jgi:hypothetical protein
MEDNNYGRIKNEENMEDNKTLFVSASQLTVEKLRSQKEKQTANFLPDFWNTEKQASEEMN